MEGPTPVSALIHAATMVTAGVYLVARAHPLFLAGPIAADVVAWVGAITALMAASAALVINDIKRVLAYSTISQLGYMFLALGVGAYGAAVFHMVTNAFFKALLFLGAGSVMHSLHDELDMRRMGGLRRYLPVTTGTFIVAWLAIAGIFPFAGFWSKDAILARAFEQNRWGLWAVGLLGAFLTAFYMARQVYLVFYGNERRRDRATVPHESPAVMTVPMIVLAVLTVLGGVLNLPFRSAEWLSRWLAPVFADAPEPAGASFAEGAALAGAALAVSAVRDRRRPPPVPPRPRRLGSADRPARPRRPRSRERLLDRPGLHRECRRAGPAVGGLARRRARPHGRRRGRERSGLGGPSLGRVDAAAPVRPGAPVRARHRRRRRPARPGTGHAVMVIAISGYLEPIICDPIIPIPPLPPECMLPWPSPIRAWLASHCACMSSGICSRNRWCIVS